MCVYAGIFFQYEGGIPKKSPMVQKDTPPIQVVVNNYVGLNQFVSDYYLIVDK